MKLGKPIKRPAITEAIVPQIVLEFDPKDHTPTGFRTILVVGWTENGQMRVDKKVEIVVNNEDLKTVLTKEEIKGLRDFHATVMKYGLEKM